MNKHVRIASDDDEPRQSQARKLAAVRNALTYEFPTGDIDQILSETEVGYRE
ncbi:hypothetical protein [Gordonia sp. ABSL49_1]|uniref:hypothetical protein n=1 Tax=unclassified Gordonia (in: high G+C Gram-positive bacteria) TaxID=2657482 RepID=UPI001F0ED6D5|nr:hypothetical protein [Gordonia sp. ABSL49_1]MCH5641594.1 hypothetical protein [Gordonia sp. ABSL49_1]